MVYFFGNRPRYRKPFANSVQQRTIVVTRPSGLPIPPSREPGNPGTQPLATLPRRRCLLLPGKFPYNGRPTTHYWNLFDLVLPMLFEICIISLCKYVEYGEMYFSQRKIEFYSFFFSGNDRRGFFSQSFRITSWNQLWKHANVTIIFYSSNIFLTN